MTEISRKSLGRIGEEAAAVYLKQKGYEIIARGYRSGHSEIDIICENSDYIVFAEVKTRRQLPDRPSPYGSPASAVDKNKQNALIRGADGYLASHPTDKIPRIDVIEVYASSEGSFSVTEIRHMENAVRKNGRFSKNSQLRKRQHETD